MTFRLLLVMTAFLSLTGSLYANGGVFYSSVIERTGNLVPMQKPRISLASETLRAVINRDDVEVAVTYVLMNHGPADSVTFGFPVDLAVPETINTPNGYDYILENSLQSFTVKDDQRLLPVEKVLIKPLPDNERLSGLDESIHLVRRWSLMTLKFEAGKKKYLSVSYKVKSIARDEGFEGDSLWKYGPRTFLYTFHPAASWGDGKAGKIEIALDTRWLRQNDLSPVSKLRPPDGHEGAGRILWTFHNQDLARLPDLTFSYDPSPLYQDVQIKKNLLESPGQIALSVSSTLPASGSFNYGKQSARDNDLRTAWVKGAKGTGVGQTMILQPKDCYVTEIGLLNGFVGNEAFYYDNARIKRLRLDIDYGEGAEETERHQVKEVTLPDRSYTDFNPRYPFGFVDWVLQHPHGNSFIDRVKITIMEVYPGRKFEDMALTEFYVCGFRR